jgi:mannose-1-phosphate guanylyltransferase / phosphomannomutase
MKAALFATRALPELAPLTEDSCDALLSVACKPLLVHNIEALAMAGVSELVVVVSPNAHAVEAALGDGTRWGMRFEYVLATAKESEPHTLERIRHRLGHEYLAIRGEMLRTPIVTEFLARAGVIESFSGAVSVSATVGGVDAGLKFVRMKPGRNGGIAFNPAALGRGDAICRSIEFPAARLAVIDSPAGLHRANLDALDGAFGPLIVPGREVVPNVRAGRHSNLNIDCVRDTPLLIGSRCRIASDAELGPNVVISDDVVIGSRATLHNAVVMPNTYVGEFVELADAIVAGNRLIHVDNGSAAIVADDFLLASTRTAGSGMWMRDGCDRILGLAVLAASLWLWPIAFLAALAKNPRRPVRTKFLIGNRQQGSGRRRFRAFEFAVSAPVLRYLPYLLAIAAGDLRIIGVQPLEYDNTEKRREEWERVRDSGWAGLFGPAQLTSRPGVPAEERLIEEAGYVVNASLAEDLKWMLRACAALASSRAWRDTKAPVAYRPERSLLAQSQPRAKTTEVPMRSAMVKKIDQSMPKSLSEAQG